MGPYPSQQARTCTTRPAANKNNQAAMENSGKPASIPNISKIATGMDNNADMTVEPRTSFVTSALSGNLWKRLQNEEAAPNDAINPNKIKLLPIPTPNKSDISAKMMASRIVYPAKSQSIGLRSALLTVRTLERSTLQSIQVEYSRILLIFWKLMTPTPQKRASP